MQIVIATRNPAKFARYCAILAGQPGLEVCSPSDLGLTLTVDETGATAAENAALKARAYAEAAQLPALGVDEALYLPALPPEQQPGVLVRRGGDRTAGGGGDRTADGTAGGGGDRTAGGALSGEPLALTDDDLLETYLALARRLSPEQRAVRWLYAVCLALPGGPSFSDEAGWGGWLTDAPCLPYSPGYPLSAILVDGLSGKPLRHMTADERRQREAPLAQAVLGLLLQAGLLPQG